ncbi:Uncharacterized conserved protein [Phaffia rhodozyma]|uniref:Uncharacterized conserved protein n=1 Tax=Phaffia rhodozyma TaxID=264483 RepID=A0A0F7SHV5_PHARH|nr:Uncharacterized conserved protein [Phaffia rhodozyma]
MCVLVECLPIGPSEVTRDSVERTIHRLKKDQGQIAVWMKSSESAPTIRAKLFAGLLIESAARFHTAGIFKAMSAPPPQSKFNFAFGTASQVHSDSLLPSISKAVAFDRQKSLVLPFSPSSAEPVQTGRPVGQSSASDSPKDIRSPRKISTQGVRKLPPTVSRSLESLLLAEQADASPISIKTKSVEQQEQQQQQQQLLPSVPSIDINSSFGRRDDLTTRPYSPESVSPLSRLSQLPLTNGDNLETASPIGKPMAFNLQPDISLILPSTTFSLNSPPKLGRPVPLPISVLERPVPITLSSSGRSTEIAGPNSFHKSFAYVRRTHDLYASVPNSADPSPPITPANFLPTARFKPPRKPAPLPPSSPPFVPERLTSVSAEEILARELASRVPSYFFVSKSNKYKSVRGQKFRSEGGLSARGKAAKPRARFSSNNPNTASKSIPFPDTNPRHITNKKSKKKKRSSTVPVRPDDFPQPKNRSSTAPVTPSSPLPLSPQSHNGDQDTVEAQTSQASTPSTVTRRLEVSSLLSSVEDSISESIKSRSSSPDWSPVRVRRDLMSPGELGSSCRSVNGYSLCDAPEDIQFGLERSEGQPLSEWKLGEGLGLRKGWSRKSSTGSMKKQKKRKETKQERKERKRLEEEMFDMDRPPTKQDMFKAVSCEVVDGDGISHSFGDLIQDQRTIVAFIRHWFCPLCQDFMYHIVREVDPQAIQRAGAKLIIIGNGKHTVIHGYQKKVFKSPFQLFTDPSLELYRALGMTRQTADGGPEEDKGEYVQHTTFTGTLSVMRNIGKQGIKGITLNPGHMNQLGGEMVVGPNLEVHYTHRMSTTRGHAPITVAMAYAGALSTEEPILPSTLWNRPDVSWKADRDGEIKRMRDWKAERRRGRLLITKLETDNPQTAIDNDRNAEKEGQKERFADKKTNKLSERPTWSPPVLMTENHAPGFILTPPQGEPKDLMADRSRSSSLNDSTVSDDHDLASSFVGFPSPPVHTLGFVRPPSLAALAAVQATSPIFAEFGGSGDWDLKKGQEKEDDRYLGLALGIKEKEESGPERVEQPEKADVSAATTEPTEKQIS